MPETVRRAAVRDQTEEVGDDAVLVQRSTGTERGQETLCRRGEELRDSEARLRAATELVGLGIYSWDPVSGALDWDARLRALWDLPEDMAVDVNVFEAGIHADDRDRVRRAIAACVDPAGDGRYNVEYRVVGYRDGKIRHVATAGRTTFSGDRAIGFIGAVVDVTSQRRNEAAVRASEAQFRSFAEHSSNLIWMGDPAAGTITYRSAAFERIWGIRRDEAPTRLTDWMGDVHPEDRLQVEHALYAVASGEIVQFEYRIVRPVDGAIRRLRDTSFPILDENGAVSQIGGVTEDLTPEEVRQVYVVSAAAVEARCLAGIVRALGYRARTFDSASTFLGLAAVLSPGCVLVDIRMAREENLSVPRELKARSVMLPAIAIDAPGADVADAVAAMKAGAIDYVVVKDEATLGQELATLMANCHSSLRATTRDEHAGARLARLTRREREVLVGLVNGGTNKSIAQKLGISPRTVELHRAQVMNRLDAGSLPELIQIALAAGIVPSTSVV